MTRLWLLLFLAPVFATADSQQCTAADLSAFWTVGTARQPSGQLLYCEFHQEISDGAAGRVIYRDGGGDKIAEKDLIWDEGRVRPQVLQQDFRSGERIEVVPGTQWLLKYQKNRTAEMQQKSLSPAEVDVVDAGFDQKMREHWDTLVKGQKLRIHFAAPALQRSVPLRITLQDNKRCPHARHADWLCFWVEADSALVRMFVDPLRLSYDQEQRLRIFEGVVNIRDSAGKKQTAIIEYRYAGEWE